MKNYYIFKSLDDCNEALKSINERKGFGKDGSSTKTWAEPLKNQTKNEWAIPFDENQIGDCIDLLAKGEKIKQDDAIARSWYFGFFFRAICTRKREARRYSFHF